MRPNSSGAAVARAGAVAALLTGSSALAQGLVGPPAPAPLTVAAPASAPPPPLAPAGSLGLAEVLASARFHAPQVLEALARVRGAQGRQLSAQAAFDTVFAVDAASRVTGFYDGTYAEATVTRPFRGIGGYAYGGYRIAGGEFPIYEDERYTNRFGEVKAGAVLSLLRDRIIDERRFGLVQAEIDIALAETDRTLIAIGVQTRAIQSYNNWVVAGLRLAIHRDLLALAQQRQAGFRRQVETGARPSILLVENEQNILRRQSLVVQSEQALAQAATSLSLYLRDADGAPLVPSSERLPRQLPPPIRVSAEAATLLARRPDVRVLSLRIDAANRRLTLDRNALLPKLDLKLEASQDIGPVPAPRSASVSACRWSAAPHAAGWRRRAPISRRTSSASASLPIRSPPMSPICRPRPKMPHGWRNWRATRPNGPERWRRPSAAALHLARRISSWSTSARKRRPMPRCDGSMRRFGR
jgi:outer membrane protein TolC